MTRMELCREIAERTELPVQDIKKIIAEEENIVLEVMGACDSLQYKWGTVMGYKKKPIKIGGMYQEIAGIKKNSGYSNWKIGFPKVKWSQLAKYCDVRYPKDYFDQPEIRYTTAARRFRREASLPELPEFETLTEEEILKICKKADEAIAKELSPTAQKIEDRKKRSSLRKTAGMFRYWEEIGYKPQGVVYYEELGDLNYKGETRDTVDHLLETKYDPNGDVRERLEMVLKIQELAKVKGEKDKHPELDQMEKELRKEIEEKGLQPLTHVPFVYVEGIEHPDMEIKEFIKDGIRKTPEQLRREKIRQLEVLEKELAAINDDQDKE